MSITIKLSDIVDALDSASEEQAYYLDKRTGEIILLTDEEMEAAEGNEFISEYPDSQRDSILKARELIREPDHFLQLPDQFEVDEHQIMEDFCRKFEDRNAAQELHRLIKGSGAFRHFKNAIRELGAGDAWYEFKQRALEKVAIKWLEENEIPYTRGDATDASEATM
jgi:Uncharacterised protein family (UPF0158)